MPRPLVSSIAALLALVSPAFPQAPAPAAPADAKAADTKPADAKSSDAAAPAKKRAGGGPENPEILFKLPPPPVLSAAEELKTIKVQPGFKVQLVASEPMVEAPIALSWDDQGRMYVVEMRGYMHDVDGLGEDQPLGRVSRLEDTDGDGVMDKSTVFADKLLMPRAVMALGDGALVGVPPNLVWYHDTNGDGVADKSEVVATDFGREGGQPEHMVNSPTWLLDNWITCAGHGTRYRWQLAADGTRKWITDTTTPGGQWGLTQDDWGHPFFNYNSALLHSHVVPPKLYARNPGLTKKTGVNSNVMPTGTTWPSHPTPGVNRGYIMEKKDADGKVSKGTLRNDGTLASVTATCGATIYRGNLFPKEFYGNAFIPEPSANLIKRVVLSEKGGLISGRNAYEGKEFLTSTDERFRPVNAYTGPDGALYVVDMARGLIQHKAFLTYYLVQNIKDRQLEQPVNLGRIYRIVPDNAKPKAVKLPKETSAIVPLLAHENGWVRDNAQRVLVERGDAKAVEPVKALLAKAPSPLAREHAIWTLEGLNALTPDIVTARLQDKDAKIRALAVRLADRTLAPELVKLAKDPSPDVRVALAFALSPQPGPEVEAALVDLLKQGGSDLIAEGVVSGLRGRELEFLQTLIKTPEPPEKPAAKAVAKADKSEKSDTSASAEIPEKGEKADKPQSADPIVRSGVLPLLSASVMAQHRAGSIGQLIDILGKLPAGSPRQLALLDGAAGKPLAKGAKPKLVYLESEPASLTALQTNAKGSEKKLLAAIDAQLAWPGKPGVPPPPIVTPLNDEQKAAFEKGRGIYAGICAGCHQPGGTGLDGLAPPLLDSDWVLGPSDVPARIVLNGLAGPVTVGSTTWHLEMPPLPMLADEDIAAVLTYIRREWEHTASPVSAKEIAKVRDSVKSRTKSWSADELKKLRAPANDDKKAKGSAKAAAPVAAEATTPVADSAKK